MGRKGRNHTKAELLDVDAILAQADATREVANRTADNTRRSMGAHGYYDYGYGGTRYHDFSVSNDVPQSEEDKQPVQRRINVGTEANPHNKFTSSRQRKAAQAAVRAAGKGQGKRK